MDNFQIKRGLTLAVLLCLIFLLSVTQQKIKANQDGIIISEVFPAPAEDQKEWVEIFNFGVDQVNLSGWKLEDQLSGPSVIYEFDDVLLESNEYMVTELTSNKLNNSADGVVLRDQNGNIVDQVSYQSSQQALSWSLDLETKNWVLTNPSPGEKNVLPEPSPTPSPSPTPQVSASPSPAPSSTPQTTSTMLELSEIFACPESDQDEWIEVYDPSNSLLSLQDFKIVDASGNSKSFDQLSINAQSLASITWTTSLLNNSSDTVSLIDQNQIQHFQVAFAQCQKGSSFIYHDGSWQLTLTPTKDTTNIFTSDSTEDTTKSESTQSETSSENQQTTDKLENKPNMPSGPPLHTDIDTIAHLQTPASSSSIVLNSFTNQHDFSPPQSMPTLFEPNQSDSLQFEIFISFMSSGLNLITGGIITLWKNRHNLKL